MKQIIKIYILLFISISYIHAEKLKIYSNEHTDILVVKQNNNTVFVEGFGGNGSLPVAADCVFKTYMSYDGDMFVGSLENVDTDMISYNIEKDDTRKVLIDINQSVLTIRDINTFGLCGLGTDFLGSYSKVLPENVDNFEKKLVSLLELLSKEEKRTILNPKFNLNELHQKSLKEHKQNNYSLIKEEFLNNGVHLYLHAYGLSKKNLSNYNDFAYFLEQSKAYKESAYLLEKILEKFPNRTVAYLNLGDAYWGLDNKEKAKQAYQTYIRQMKEKGKEKKIPKVVLKRVD